MLIAFKRLPYSRRRLFVVISRRAKNGDYGVNGVPIALDIQIVKQIEKLFNLLFIVRSKDSLNLRHKVLAKEIQIQKVLKENGIEVRDVFEVKKYVIATIIMLIVMLVMVILYNHVVIRYSLLVIFLIICCIKKKFIMKKFKEIKR